MERDWLMIKINIIKNAKSIKMKILYSFILFLLTVWGYAAYNYFQNEKLTENSQHIINEEVSILSMANGLSNSIDVRLASARGYVLTGDSNYKNTFASSSQEALEIQQSLQQYEDYKDIEKTVSDAIEWSTIIQNDVFPLYDQGDIDGAIAILTSLDTRGNAIHDEYKAFAQTKDTAIKEHGNNLANDMNSTKKILFILSYALTAVALVLGFYVSNNISKPITHLMNRIESISNRNLNHEPLKITSNDEVGRLTLATNDMNEQLKDIVMNIQEGASTVTESSNNLKVAAQEVTNGMTQTNEAMEQIAEGTEAQATSASDLRTIMQTFTQNVEQANENSLKVQSHSESVQAMTEEGQKLINDTEQQMYKIDTIVKQAVNRVEGLNNQTREITQLVQVITEIADQTNLLALNAAIEAARAGEQGKGFAVVADEVRKLAEQVSHSVSNISTIVNKIQNETNVVTRSLVEGYEEVEKGSKQTQFSSETYQNISAAITEMVSNIKSVTQNLQHIANNTNEIDHAIENIAAISEQSAASSEQTAATIQEVTSSMESVAHNAEQLNGTADKLQEVVQQFKL